MSNRFQRILYFFLLLYLHQPVMAQEEEAKENTGKKSKKTTKKMYIKCFNCGEHLELEMLENRLLETSFRVVMDKKVQLD